MTHRYRLRLDAAHCDLAALDIFDEQDNLDLNKLIPVPDELASGIRFTPTALMRWLSAEAFVHLQNQAEWRERTRENLYLAYGAHDPMEWRRLCWGSTWNVLSTRLVNVQTAKIVTLEAQGLMIARGLISFLKNDPRISDNDSVRLSFTNENGQDGSWYSFIKTS